MARRTKTMLLAAACTLLVAAPAEAALVYVTKPAAVDAHVWVARDDGTQARKVGPGHSPKISPGGRWVAWVKDGSPDHGANTPSASILIPSAADTTSTPIAPSWMPSIRWLKLAASRWPTSH